ncbi:MAG: hypothetical protein M3350_01465 [Actinomycetota bacterium]|nr:hypothetical protein [Actinomycetota bacterium]
MLAVGIVAAAMFLTALFVPIASVDVANGSCEVINDASPELADRCSLTVTERRGAPGVASRLLVAAAMVGMAIGAGLDRSHPAAAALVALGATALLIGLLVDLPEASKTGAIGRSFEGAKGTKGPGLYLELGAGGLAAAAGLMRAAGPAGQRGRACPADTRRGQPPKVAARTDANRWSQRFEKRAWQGRGARRLLRRRGRRGTGGCAAAQRRL